MPQAEALPAVVPVAASAAVIEEAAEVASVALPVAAAVLPEVVAAAPWAVAAALVPARRFSSCPMIVSRGVFILRGKDDAIVTKNMNPGESVYNEKRVTMEVSSLQ